MLSCTPQRPSPKPHLGPRVSADLMVAQRAKAYRRSDHQVSPAFRRHGGPLPSAAFRRFGVKPPVGLVGGRGQRREVATGAARRRLGPPDASNLGRTCWAYDSGRMHPAAPSPRPGGALGLREPTGSVSMRQAPSRRTLLVPPRAPARGAKLLQGSNHFGQPRAGPSGAPRKPGLGSVQACRCGVWLSRRSAEPTCDAPSWHRLV